MMQNPLKRRQQEQKIVEMNRLPPGQALTNHFPVLHHGAIPPADLAAWNFKIYGRVEEEQSWDWDTFNTLPRTKVTLDLHCVTRWSKFDTVWEGVSVRRLIDEGLIRPKPDAHFVVQHCEGGYTTNTPLDLLMQDNFLLATHYEGKPISTEHGFPMRGLIGAFADPEQEKSAYLWKGGKWLRALEFCTEDQLGFWEKVGYHNEADPWKEQRFA